MHLRTLQVSNFRAIESAHLEELPSAVVIAGPNGCGKSCLLDAIRIWKAAYGGYNDSEFQQGFSEFGINVNRFDTDLPTLFRDRTRPIIIRAGIVLSDVEKAYIEANINDLVARFRHRTQGTDATRSARRTPRQVSGTNDAAHRATEAWHKNKRSEILRELKSDLFFGEFRVTADLELEKSPSPVLELIYSLFMPDAIGIFEYHSAQRYYQQREEITSVNLKVESAAEQQSQQALFNWAAKYQSVKAQLVGSYVRELIAKQADAASSGRESLVQSLVELFRLFFPDKTFLGPQPRKDGSLTLNVRTAAGKEHDITDLSSGEKEVLYGYLRLRNLAPRNSVLLLDEPELHLNPRLVRGLPRFYRTHLGEAFSNQIWLITHSDALLEEALDLKDFAVFHMVPAESSESAANQLFRVTDESLDRAIIDLVGEKAAYRPKGKLVIFEGGGDSDFDLNLACDLFPELRAAKVNPISGSNRARVIELRRLLEKAVASGTWSPKVYSVTDRDSTPFPDAVPGRELSWDVYHIENYLLEPKFILSALQEALREKCQLATLEEVESSLRDAAEEALEAIVADRVVNWARQTVYGCLKIGADPSGGHVVEEIHASATRSAQRVHALITQALTQSAIATQHQSSLEAGHNELLSGEWRSNLPGRAILSRFVGRYGGGLSYEVVRNLIIARMRSEGYQPAGMKRIIEIVLSD